MLVGRETAGSVLWKKKTVLVLVTITRTPTIMNKKKNEPSLTAYPEICKSGLGIYVNGMEDAVVTDYRDGHREIAIVMSEENIEAFAEAILRKLCLVRWSRRQREIS